MASTLALGPVVTAVLAALRATVALTGYVGARVYPDDNGDVPAKPTYPYVQVESAGETEGGASTMGSPSSSHFGSIPRLQIRVGSNARSDAQANAITNIIKQALDQQPLTVSGFAFVNVDYVDLAPLKDLVGGVTIREWVSTYEVLVHQ